MIKQEDWGIVLDSVLQGPLCNLRDGSDVNSTISWMRYPAWLNGFVGKCVSEIHQSPRGAGLPVLDPYGLPALGSFASGSSMENYVLFQEESFIMTTHDMSGLPTVTAWEIISSLTPYFPENVCVDTTDPRGFLHPRAFLMMYYRADAIAQLHAAGRIASPLPPNDWEELHSLLAAHHAAVSEAGQVAGVGTLPKHGLCITTHVDCGRLGDVLAAIAASVMQTAGTAQGVYWDMSVPPPAATPLVDSSGWRYAAEMLRRLLEFNAPEYSPISGQEGDNTSNTSSSVTGDGECTDLSQHFVNGDCMLTVEWDVVLSSLSVPSLRAPGVAVAVAPLPGSRIVMDRRSGSRTAGDLVNCTWELCAASANHDLLYLDGHAASDSTGLSSSMAGKAVSVARQMERLAPAAVVEADDGHPKGCNPRELMQLEAAAVEEVLRSAGPQARSGQPVNRAPYSVILQSFTRFNAETAPAAQEAMQLLTTVRDALDERLSEQYALKNAAAVAARQALGYPGTAGPRGDALVFSHTRWWTALAQPFDVGGFLALNLSDDTAQTYMQAVWHALHAPNGASDVSSPNPANFAKWGLARAALLLTSPDASPAAVATTALASVFELINDAFGAASVRKCYEYAIDGEWISLAQPLPDSGSSDDGDKMLAALLAGLLGTVGLATLALGLLLLLRMRRGHRDVMGRVRAPRVSPDTTLLISDVQNSTRLWEELSVPAMDSALKIHHATFRRVMEQYDGYESATEGDSFLIAFSAPSSALAFASACQLELLKQDWPVELLAHPDGALVAADPRDGGLKVNSACALASSGMKMAPGLRLNCAVTNLMNRIRQSRSSLGPASASPDIIRRLEPSVAASEDGSRSTMGLDEQFRALGLTMFGRGSGNDDEAGSGEMEASAAEKEAALRKAAESMSVPSLTSLDGKTSAGSYMGLAAAGWWSAASRTWRSALAAAFPLAPPTLPPAAVLTSRACKITCALAAGEQATVVFRGLCVRMGIHCGLDDPRHLVFNKVGSSYKYYGPILETAKLVGDAAPGGIITLSSQAFERLRHSDSADHRASSCGAVVLYAGHHVLVEAKPPAGLAPASPAIPTSYVAAISSSEVQVSLTLSGAGLQGKDQPTQEPSRTPAPPSEGAAGGEEVPLFVAVPEPLLCRLAHVAPLRSVRETQLGSLGAPTGTVAIAFMKVVGASALLADLPGPAARALDQFQRLVCRLLGDQGGYLVEGGDGLVLAAFGSPAAGVEWALDCVDDLQELAWEDVLLAHELCEEVVTVRTAGGSSPAPTGACAAATRFPPPLGLLSGGSRASSTNSGTPLSHESVGRSHWGAYGSRDGTPAASSRRGLTTGSAFRSPSPGGPFGDVMAAVRQRPSPAAGAALAAAAASLEPSPSLRILAAPRRLVERGLRIKVGLDVGPVTYSLTESSGRLSYRGKVMNRAARIAARAAAGQVLCSAASWLGCEAVLAQEVSGGREVRGMVGVSLGKVALKGIGAPVEVVQCGREG